jgi:hypothetical protein
MQTKHTSSPPRSPRRRGTAEFEALFAAIFLLGIIFLGAAAMRIGIARMSSGDQAQYLTWHDAYDTDNPQYTNGPLSQPITGLDSLRSDPLPNRVYAAEVDIPVIYGTGYGSTPSAVTLHEIAIVPGPTWNISGNPIRGADQAMIENWFENYAQDSIGEVSVPLALDPSWYP